MLQKSTRLLSTPRLWSPLIQLLVLSIWFWVRQKMCRVSKNWPIKWQCLVGLFDRLIKIICKLCWSNRYFLKEKKNNQTLCCLIKDYPKKKWIYIIYYIASLPSDHLYNILSSRGWHVGPCPRPELCWWCQCCASTESSLFAKELIEWKGGPTGWYCRNNTYSLRGLH